MLAELRKTVNLLHYPLLTGGNRGNDTPFRGDKGGLYSSHNLSSNHYFSPCDHNKRSPTSVLAQKLFVQVIRPL